MSPYTGVPASPLPYILVGVCVVILAAVILLSVLDKKNKNKPTDPVEPDPTAPVPPTDEAE